MTRHAVPFCRGRLRGWGVTVNRWVMLLGRSVRRVTPTEVWPGLLFLRFGTRSRLLREFGYARSLKLKVPLNDRGEPLPWMPYCLSALLDERLGPTLKALEFGAGYSTLFLMRRVARVVSVEHNARWAAELRGRIGANVTILDAPATPSEAYLEAVAGVDERYDVIVVDGLHRIECFQWAVDHLTPPGVIVLDDSDRIQYQELFGCGRKAGFKALHLQSHKPCSVGLHRSTIFYRCDNCLGI